MRRHKIRTVVSGALMAAAIGLAPGIVWAQSLADTMIRAYSHSGLLRQNQALLRAADEDVAQAVAALRPVVSYLARSTYNNPVGPMSNRLSASVTLQAEMLLFDFGNSQLAVDAAKETVLSTRESLVSVEQAILLRAVAAHFNVRRNAAFVQLQDNNVQLLDQQLRATRDRFEVGEVTRTDVSIAEARAAAARAGAAAAQGNLATAREEYRAAVGQYPGSLAPPPAPPKIPASVGEARAVALARNPTLKAAQRDVKVAEINIERGEKNFRPSLRGSASVSIDEDGDDSQSLSLTLSGPIYQGGQLASVLRRFHALAQSARANLHETRHSVEQDVGDAWSGLTVARSSVMASEENVRASRVALRGAQEELSVGQRTTLDVLDLEQELLQAETDRISAIIDRDLAVYQLLETMGLLTAAHLRLGVPTYDPEAYFNAVKDAPTVTVSPQGERLDRVMRALGKN